MNNTKPDQTPVHVWTPWGRMDAPKEPKTRLMAPKTKTSQDAMGWLARNLTPIRAAKLPA